MSDYKAKLICSDGSEFRIDPTTEKELKKVFGKEAPYLDFHNFRVSRRAGDNAFPIAIGIKGRNLPAEIGSGMTSDYSFDFYTEEGAQIIADNILKTIAKIEARE